MTSPQPPDPRFPVWDPHPHPLDLLAGPGPRGPALEYPALYPRARTGGIAVTEPAIDDGYPQEAAAETRAAQSDQAQAGADQEARYLPTLAEPHPERYSYEAAVNGEYPALCDAPDCKPCQAPEAAWRQEEAALDAAWRRDELARASAVEAAATEPEARL